MVSVAWAHLGEFTLRPGAAALEGSADLDGVRFRRQHSPDRPSSGDSGTVPITRPGVHRTRAFFLDRGDMPIQNQGQLGWYLAVTKRSRPLHSPMAVTWALTA